MNSSTLSMNTASGIFLLLLVALVTKSIDIYIIKLMLQRVFLLRINSTINAELHQKVLQGLNSWLYKPSLIAVHVDSTGGSIIQAKNIANTLQLYASKTLAPLYCFAGSQVLSSANIILSCGDKVYGSPFSVIGDFGYSGFVLNFYEMLQQNKIDARLITQGKFKARLNPFQQVKQQDVEWLSGMLQNREQQLWEELIIKRGNRMKAAKVTQDQLEEVLQGSFLNTSKAMKVGLIDHEGEISDILKDKVGDQKFYHVVKEKKGFS